MNSIALTNFRVPPAYVCVCVEGGGEIFLFLSPSLSALFILVTLFCWFTHSATKVVTGRSKLFLSHKQKSNPLFTTHQREREREIKRERGRQRERERELAS